MPYLFYQYHPSRPVDWRFRRIIEVVRRAKWPNRQKSDAAIAAGCRFLLRYDRVHTNAERRQLCADYPGLYYAHDLHIATTHETRFVIEARILAGQSDDQIAAKVGASPETISWYEALYYNVRDRLTFAASIVNAIHRGAFYESEQQVQIKLWGYFGGPVVLDHLLCPYQVLERPAEEPLRPDYFDDLQKLNLRQLACTAAIAMKIDRTNNLGLQRLHVRIMKHDQKGGIPNEMQEANQAADETLDALRKMMGLGTSHGKTRRPKVGAEDATAQVHKGKPHSRPRKQEAAQKQPSEKTPVDLI